MLHLLATAVVLGVVSIVGARVIMLGLPTRRPWAARIAEFRWQLRATLVLGGVLLVAWLLTH